MKRVKLGAFEDLFEPPHSNSGESADPIDLHFNPVSQPGLTDNAGHSNPFPFHDVLWNYDWSNSQTTESTNSPANPGLACFLPPNYQSAHRYPLIIWLHSACANQQQLNQKLPLISDQNYVGAAFNGSEYVNQGRFDWLQTPAAIESTSNQISQLIEVVSNRFNINRERIFIAGEGTGATMAFRLAFEHPDWFAGVASFNGSLPANLNPLLNWRSCRSVPVYWAHGRNSIHLPESNLCYQMRLLHVAGFDVTLRQYPCGNELIPQSYSDFDSWIMEQLAGQGANIIS